MTNKSFVPFFQQGTACYLWAYLQSIELAPHGAFVVIEIYNSFETRGGGGGEGGETS